MESKEVKVNEKSFIVHELLATEFDEIQKIDNSTDRVVELIKLSTNMSNDDYTTLTLKERTEIQEVINELNGWSEPKDFQESETEKNK